MNSPASRPACTSPAERVCRISVMNPKGGCGKTTVATNLVSHYARTGWQTTLFDYDPLGASARWLRTRPGDRPAIHGVEAFAGPPASMTRSWQLRIPAETQRVVIDTPAGLERQQLLERIRDVDVILIPVLPSPIDIGTTADFIRDLLLVGKLRTRHTRVGIVANRVKSNTRAFQSLERFLDTLDIPLVARLRETQQYISAAQQGVGVHEMAAARDTRDQENWQSIVDWIENPVDAYSAAASHSGRE